MLIDGCTFGSISMTAYTLDATPVASTTGDSAAAALPDPEVVPPEDTNL